MKTTKILCRSCRWHVYKSGIVGKVRQEWPACDKQVNGFPEMTMCRDYQREPGGDDE